MRRSLLVYIVLLLLLILVIILVCLWLSEFKAKPLKLREVANEKAIYYDTSRAL